MKGSYFENNKVLRQEIEQELLYSSGGWILTINNYFLILRFNSNVHNYKEMIAMYKKCVRFFICAYLPNNEYIIQNKTSVPDYILADDAYKVLSTASQHGSNFEQVNVEDKPDTVLINLLYSIKNLRKNTV